jgi:hypothetical protein
MQRICVIGLILVFGIFSRGEAQRIFPEWRGSNVLLPSVWKASPIAAVGEVVNIHPYGQQIVEKLPWPMSPDVHKLYWCEGDFRVIATVKGELSRSAEKYLWASSLPGCKLWNDNPRLVFNRFRTRVWLLREEGEILRPTFDGGTVSFIGFFAKWDENSRQSPQRQLGALFLTPAANSDALEDYARYLWEVGDVACELLGRAECVREIRALGELGNSALRDNACHFLKGQLDEDCPSK